MVESILGAGQRSPGSCEALLGRALALYVEGGMTEAEALCALHSGVLERAGALGVLLEGDRE
jgi:hypothetical protein